MKEFKPKDLVEHELFGRGRVVSGNTANGYLVTFDEIPAKYSLIRNRIVVREHELVPAQKRNFTLSFFHDVKTVEIIRPKIWQFWKSCKENLVTTTARKSINFYTENKEELFNMLKSEIFTTFLTSSFDNIKYLRIEEHFSKNQYTNNYD